MLQKTQSSVSRQRVKASPSNRLSAGERGLLQLAVIDDEDRLLHIACSKGVLLRELLKRYSCETCGTTNSLENLRYSRQMLPEADVIYAQPDEIPWRDESFSVLMCNAAYNQVENPGRMMEEAMRVLKPGGQILIALPWYPVPIAGVINYLANQAGTENPTYCYSKQEAVASLEAMGFESVTWHPNELGSSVVVGWKPKFQ